MKKLLTSLLLLVGLATPAYAQLGSVPYTFSPGTTISSSQFNQMFSEIYSNALRRTGGIMTGSLTTVGVLPTADNVSDIGSAALSYNDAWFDGTVTVNTLTATTINGAFSGGINSTQRITATLTTEQIRAAYDGSNYYSITVASNGATTFNATGAGAAFTFSDAAEFTLGLTERGRTVKVGEWANQTYSAGDYTASSVTWGVDSGDVTTNRYSVIGKTVTWQLVIHSTDVGGTPTNLRVAVPGGLTEATLVRGGTCGRTTDAGTTAAQLAYWIMDGAGYVKLQLISDGAWSTTTSDNTAVTCTITFEIA